MEGEWHFLFPLAHWCVTFTGVGHFCKHLKFLAALLVKDISFKWSLDQLSVVYGDDASVPLGLCVQLYLVFVCLNSLSCLTKALVFQAEQCLVSADSNQRFSDKILITIQLSGYYWVRKTALPEKTPMWIHGSACFPAVSFEWALIIMKRTDACLFLCLPVQSMSQPKETVFYFCEPCVPEAPLWGCWRLIRPNQSNHPPHVTRMKPTLVLVSLAITIFVLFFFFFFKYWFCAAISDHSVLMAASGRHCPPSSSHD